MCWLIFIGLLFFHIDTDILAIFKQRLTRHNEMIISKIDRGKRKAYLY